MSDLAAETSRDGAGEPREPAATGFFQAVGFVFLLGGVFIYLSNEVTNIQGKGKKSAPPGVNAERGEIVFWDPVDGVCHQCHKMASKGSMTRCPDLGESDLGPPIWERAALRAVERTEQTGVEYTAVDYLVECLASPSAYVVEGFPDKLMPLVYTGQTDLSIEEVMSVLAYLQSLGGETDIAAIQKSMTRFGQPILNKADIAEEPARQVSFLDPAWVVLPLEKLQIYRDLGGSQRAEYLANELTEEEQEDLGYEIEDWIELGRDAFETLKCWQCHTIAGEDFGPLEQGKIGPELTGIGDIQSFEYLRESILNPNAVIVPPLEDNADAEGRSKMPDFSDSLNLAQLNQVVYYLAHLRAGAGGQE